MQLLNWCKSFFSKRADTKSALEKQTERLKQQILRAKLSGLVIEKFYPHNKKNQMRMVAIKYKEKMRMVFFKEVNGKYYLVNSFHRLNEIDHASLFVELSGKTNSK